MVATHALRTARVPRLAESHFGPPLAISKRHPRLGFTLPIIAHRPLVAQPAAAPLSHPLLLNYLGEPLAPAVEPSPAETAAREALELLGTDPERAGPLFRDARIACERTPRDVSRLPPLYVVAALGEATYDQGSDDTARALREVKHFARHTGNQDLLASERLARAVMLTRWGQEEDAARVLAKFSRDNAHKCSPVLRVRGLLHYANLLLNRAARQQDPAVRQQALTSLRHIFRTVIPDFLPKDNDLPPEAMAVVAKAYYFFADVFLQLGRSLDARDLLFVGRAVCRDDEQLASLFETDAVAEHDEEEGPAKHGALRRLVQTWQSPDAISFGQRTYAWLAEFLPRARFRNNRAVGKAVFLGCTAGAAIAASMAAVAGEPQAVADIMVGSALGATGALAAGKVVAGVQADEPWQALATGYTERTIGGPLLLEAAKLLATYTVFGGPLPGVEALVPSLLVAGTDHGGVQLHGIGSGLSYLVERTATHLDELSGFIAQHGLPDGVAAFWQHWTETSAVAQGLDNGFTFPFSEDPWRQLFGNASFSRFSSCLDGIFNGWLPGSVQTGIESVIYAYMGAGGIYAFASMTPQLRRLLEGRMGEAGLRSLERRLFPGAALMTVAAMVASGMDPMAAAGFTAVSYLVQMRLILQGGGLAGVDMGKMMRAGAIQLLYLAPGAALMPELAKSVLEDPNAGMLDKIGAGIEAHFGIVAFLATLGGAHAVLTGLNPSQTLLAKYAKAMTWEIPVQVMKLLLGWLSFLGNTAALVLKEAGFGAITSASIREAGGSPVQEDTVTSRLKPLRETALDALSVPPLGLAVNLELRTRMVSEAREFRLTAAHAAANGEAMEFHDERFASQPRGVQLRLATMAYFLRDDGRVLLKSRLPAAAYHGVVYKALTDETVAEAEVADYLDRLKVIACDAADDLADGRRNLLVATVRAAIHPVHGDRIREFFTSPDGQAILVQYKLQSDYDSVLQYQFPKALAFSQRYSQDRWRPKRWIKVRLQAPPEQPFYDTAVVAGRRIRITGPFTGRTVREAGAPLFTMLDSITQTDVAHQTRADPSFYYGTLWKRVLMRKTLGGQSVDKYRTEMVLPLLEAVRRIASRVHDVRADIRHNLLLAVELAAEGPHAEVVKPFIAEHRGIFTTMHSIRASLLASGEHLPRNARSWRECRMAKRIFARLMIDSGNSADGMLVEPVVRESAFDKAQQVVAAIGHRESATGLAPARTASATQPRRPS